MKPPDRPTLITPALLRRWPLPALDGHLGKEDRGQVLVVGGSTQVPGAVLLAATAALRAGAGKLQIATSATVAPTVAVAVPEARVIGLPQTRLGELRRGGAHVLRHELAHCDALLVGPGMSAEPAAEELIAHWSAHQLTATLVLDAAALRPFGRRRRPVTGPGNVLLTPHAGEMATLCALDRDEVVARPLPIARAVAARLGATVALKGKHTYVVAPDGTAFCNTAGNLGLGTSGSGDTLSGVIAGLCARGATPLQAAVWGVYVHATAGDVLARKLGPLGFLARELLDEVPPLLTRFGRPPGRGTPNRLSEPVVPAWAETQGRSGSPGAQGNARVEG